MTIKEIQTKLGNVPMSDVIKVFVGENGTKPRRATLAGVELSDDLSTAVLKFQTEVPPKVVRGAKKPAAAGKK